MKFLTKSSTCFLMPSNTKALWSSSGSRLIAPPIADARPHQTIDAGAVILDGSASYDPILLTLLDHITTQFTNFTTKFAT